MSLPTFGGLSLSPRALEAKEWRIPCKCLLEPEGLRFGKFWS